MKLPLSLLLVVLTVGGAAAEPEPLAILRAAPHRILAINRPELFAAPDRGAERAATDWRAGRQLDWSELHHDESTLCALSGSAATTAPLELWVKVSAGDRAGWLPDPLLSVPPSDPAAPAEIGTERVDRWLGLPPDYAPSDLVEVGPGYNKDVTYRLRSEAAGALRSMIAAARADGIKLVVVSAYRPWSTQQALYERRIGLSGWDQGSVARPGHSEHQLGTAVDLSDGDERTMLRAAFADTEAGRWLRENAWVYGFAQSYTAHNRPRTGYIPEPWHFRYWGIARARSKHLEALGVER